MDLPLASVDLPIRSGELLSLRSAARNLYDTVTRLNLGEVDKYVLLDNKHDVKAVVISPAKYADLLEAASRPAGAQSADPDPAT
jgi:hypothetical protein